MEWRLGDAARRLEYHWSLLNVRTAVGGTAVKILIRRIGERGSNYFANYHFKQWIALEPSSDVYRETFRDTSTKEPTNHTTHNHQSQVLGEAMGRNKMKETTGPMGAQDRGEAQHGSTTRRRVVGTLTRAYGGDSRLWGDSYWVHSASIRGRNDSAPTRGARVGRSVQQSKPYQKIKLIVKTRRLTTRF